MLPRICKIGLVVTATALLSIPAWGATGSGATPFASLATSGGAILGSPVGSRSDLAATPFSPVMLARGGGGGAAGGGAGGAAGI